MTYHVKNGFELLPVNFNAWKVSKPLLAKKFRSIPQVGDLYPNFSNRTFSQSFIFLSFAWPFWQSQLSIKPSKNKSLFSSSSFTSYGLRCKSSSLAWKVLWPQVPNLFVLNIFTQTYHNHMLMSDHQILLCVSQTWYKNLL